MLRKCSRCHSEMLEEFFTRNRKGELQKCCDTCLKRFHCEQCEYKTSRKCDLNKHIKQVHEKIKDVECPSCEFKCSTKSQLNQHIKQVHDKIKDVHCPTCEFKCTTQGQLKIHIKAVHDKIKDVHCPTCEFKCSTKGDLKNHIKAVHDKIKDVHCPTCEFKCSAQSDLKAHIKAVHDKIKDVNCPSCEFKCSTQSNLKAHIKMVHDKIKDFECTSCDYKCSTRGDLNRHIKLCTGSIKCSSGELQVMQALNKLNIEYVYDQSYDGLKDKRYLRWDFRIDTTPPRFIEYDGEYHYNAIKKSKDMTLEQAQANLETTQKRDKIKTDHCTTNGYPLLRIAYWDKDKIENLVTEFIL